MTMQTTRDIGERPKARASVGADVGTDMPWVLSLDFVVYVIGAWTIGFWIALAFGLGWVFASLFAVATGAGLVALHRRWPVARFDVSSEWLDTVPICMVLALVVCWPIVVDLGRTTIAVAAAVLLVVRVAVPVLRRSFARCDVRLLILAATALLVTLAYWASWTTLAVALCLLVGIVVFRPQWTEWLAATTTGRGRRAPWVASLLLALLGALIAVWWIGVPVWNPDNTYYLNKALHYASSPFVFSTGDRMFGVGGATHYPAGDLVSSFEPLLGALSSVTPVSVPDLVFRLAAPLAMLAIPLSVRYAARGLGLKRTNLAGALAAAALMLMSAIDTFSLFASASTGKTIGRLVFIPIVIGAVADLVRRKDPPSAVKATLATVVAVGFSPSLALPAGVVVAPFVAAGLWDTFSSRRDAVGSQLRTYLCVSLPLAFLACYSVVAQFIQTRAGASQEIALFHFDSPANAWTMASVSAQAEHSLTVVFLIGATALFALLPPMRAVRRGAALVLLFLFGILLAPWTFDAIVDDVLGLNYFAWRFVWALPTVMLVGLALAHVDLRRRLSLVSIAAFTLALGLATPPASFLFLSVVDVRHAPAVWPWEAGIPDFPRDAARAVVDATPDGGRFLAPSTVEEVATASQVDRFPTYAREHYAEAVGQADTVPRDFFSEQRLLLARAMEGQQAGVRDADWRAALTRLDVATVCMDKRTAPGLRAVVMQMYKDAGSAGLCQLWTRHVRPPPADTRSG